MVASALSASPHEAQASFYRLLPAINMLFEEGNPAGVKGFLHAKGICTPFVRLPLVAASDTLMQRINTYRQ